MATRRERVVLELDDQFTTGMARAAAASALLAKELNALDGSGRKSKQSLSSASVEAERVGKSSRKSAADVDVLGSSMRKNGAEIDKLSGRLRLFADAAAVLGPGLIPIGAVGIPAVAGLASQLGFAAVAGGVAVAAFQGVGDALTAVNKAALEPTEANLEKARQAMQQISPAARDFVGELRDLIPALKNLRDIGAEEMFPGLTRGLNGLEGALPKIEAIMAAVSREIGSIGGDIGESLGGERWAPFLDFIAAEAPVALREMATSIGNVGHAMAELWMAFAPLNSDFSSWMVKATGDLDRWASGLSKTEGFREFVDYVRTTGPQVADTMAALGNAMVQIVQAAAPLGGPVLAGLEGVAKAIGAIADSDLGTPIFTALAALALYNRAMQTTKNLSATTWGGKAKSNVLGMAAALDTTARTQQRASMSVSQYAAANRASAAAFGKAAAGVGALALVTTGAADSFGLTNTAVLGLAGSMLGPWGAAVGAAAGGFMDVKAAGDKFGDTMDNVNAALRAGDWDTASKGLKQLDAAFADINKHEGFFDQLSDEFRRAAGVLTGDIKPGNWNPFETSTKKARPADDRAAAQAEARRIGELNRASVGRNAAAQAMNAAARLEAQGFALTAAGAKSAAMSVKEFASSITAANDALTRQGTLDAYTTSLLDMQEALKANGKTLDGNTRAGLANRAGMRQMASSALEYAGNMKQADRRTQFLDRARGDFIKMARALGASAPAARRMANEFGLVDQGAKRASGSAKRLSGSLNDIPKNVRTRIAEVGAAKARGMIVDLTRRYNLTPKQVRTLIRESGATPTKAKVDSIIRSARILDRTNPSSNITAKDNASGKIASVKQMLNSVPRNVSSTITITTVRQNRGASGNVGRGDAQNAGARGMLWVGGERRFAQGGFGDVANRHQPELAGPGPTRIWREPETMGEAYIPLANDDRRPRAQAIAAETVSLLGGVASFDRGGFDTRGIGGAGGFSGGVAVAPVVNVSMAGARVLIDAGELGTIVGEVIDDALASQADMTSMVERTGAAYGSV